MHPYKGEASSAQTSILLCLLFHALLCGIISPLFSVITTVKPAVTYFSLLHTNRYNTDLVSSKAMRSLVLKRPPIWAGAFSPLLTLFSPVRP